VFSATYDDRARLPCPLVRQRHRRRPIAGRCPPLRRGGV